MSRPARLLWVGIGFPPKNDPEGLQVAKYLKYLLPYPELSISAVTSANPTLWMGTDPTLERYANGCAQVVEVPIFEPRLLSIALLKLAAPLVMLPDTRMSFHWQWRRVVRQLRQRPDVILSRAFPLSGTLMAYRLQRHYGVPWILHLSDPWIDSPIIRYRGPSAYYHRHAQRVCFDAATKISLASPRMVDFYRERYPRWRDKFELYPNVFDEEDLVEPPPHEVTAPPLRVVYTGSLVGDRRISWFLDGLQALTRVAPAEAAQIELQIAGSLDSANVADLARAALPNVRLLGHLPYSEAVRLQREADVLLVIDNPLPVDAAMFLPSKVLDYQTTRNPVLAITTPGSMTSSLIQGASGLSVDHADREGIARFLRSMLERKRAGTPVRGTAPGPAADYGAGHNARRLRDEVVSLLGARATATSRGY